MSEKPDVKNTLNLPRTSFAMKASLAQKEPEMIAKWEKEKLYQRIIAKRKGRPTFILHDGPPYANGHIHLGTALNKILKDFVVKTKTMQGFLSPYVPGWDCHGLPIEIHVDKELGERKKDMTIPEIREECRKYALKYVDIQRNEFKRLGVLGEWEEPYLTLHPTYEGDVVRSLAAFFASGNIYKGMRPVHWCPRCETALAEAEIEYMDKTSPSITVRFPMVSDLSASYPELGGRKVFVLIWTTTPWTLPANLAIAFHPDHDYAAVDTGNEVYIVAKRLVPVLADELGWEDPHILVTFPGRAMDGLKARHPFIDRESLILLADYVTLEDGTGCVHTAPGHGHDDYMTGIAYNLDIYTPVDEQGRFVEDVEKYGGKNVFEANPLITADMKRDGTLLKEGELTHSYPHCWRCKSPVIFRATEQWFISMNAGNLRTRALEEIKKVRWIPSWGEERIMNMMEGRPDWCISRQRSWGVPLPAFNCRECGAVLADARITHFIADLFTREGSGVWFLKDEEDLLPPGTKCPQCGAQKFRKEKNILDVWFESGASHTVLGKRPDLPWPADIYVEGHDQYRGWFNSSLLIGVGAKAKSPYETCITHGFVLDEQGRAMSKSLGNVIEPEEVVAKNGAEILRLWVAMLNYKEDARFGRETLQRLIEAYRKIRNTWRFMLGNLYDFSPGTDMVAKEEMLFLDRYILEKAAGIRRKVLKAYEAYEYHVVIHTLYNFFTVEMSAFYLDVIKDRAYCSGKDSRLRRSVQSALFAILKDSLLLLAPLLPFTAEEAWEAMPDYAGKEGSVHLELFPAEEGMEAWLEPDLYADMEDLAAVREQVLKELEKGREEKLIGNSLEASLTLRASASQAALLKKHEAELPSLFIVSSVAVEEGHEETLTVEIGKAPGGKCERCWNYSRYVGTSASYPTFCARCEDVAKGECA